jgi:CRISPR-associated protein Cas1
MKRTLYFGNPCYLKTKNDQLVIKFPEKEGLSEKSFPIEDLGIVILDHQQITIGSALLSKLLESNVALVSCNNIHLPTGLMLNLDGNSLQSQKFRAQLNASIPLKKQLWQQTVTAKIANQMAVLDKLGRPTAYLQNLSGAVRSGDPDNQEAKAASYYWKQLFGTDSDFVRDRIGSPPNNLLNYGYAILRATVARALVASGLLPTLGIFHRNQYNAYCLADDIMEPYRPWVDMLVFQLVRNRGHFLELTPDMKKQFLELPVMDVWIDGSISPLMTGVSKTTASLVKCFEGTDKKVIYPKFN